MSWQQYVDQNLMCALDTNGTTLASAALVGQDGGVWAQSEAFPAMTPEEVAGIMSVLGGTNPGSFTIGGVKYMVLMSEEPDAKLRGKCKGGGCAISKTAQTLVVGVWAEPVPASSCNKVVEALAEYLLGVDY
jgi:profilin